MIRQFVTLFKRSITRVFLTMSKVDFKTITDVRQRLIEKLVSDPKSYDIRDLDLINHDWYLSLFVNEKKSIDTIVDKIDQTLRWRHSSNIRDVKITEFPQIIYRQNIYEYYKVDQTLYIILNYRNLLIPSGFEEVYSRFTTIWTDVNMYARGQGQNIVHILDMTNIKMANVNISFLLKVSLSFNIE